MGKNCNTVVFSNRAYNAIIRESFKKDPVETGGILLGHIIDDTWVVMEVLPPGKHSIFQVAYFEYDKDFVNYLADSVANQYEYPLELLGLWHRHPGSMDVFSGTDDITNTTFALENPQGVISGIVNIDPKFRFTMYHLANPGVRQAGKPYYDMVEVVVGDDVIPPEFFKLRFVNSEDSDLHPIPVKEEESPKEYVVNDDGTLKEKIKLENDSDSHKVSILPITTEDVEYIPREHHCLEALTAFLHRNKRDILFFCLGIAFTCLVKVCYVGTKSLATMIPHLIENRK